MPFSSSYVLAGISHICAEVRPFIAIHYFLSTYLCIVVWVTKRLLFRKTAVTQLTRSPLDPLSPALPEAPFENKQTKYALGLCYWREGKHPNKRAQKSFTRNRLLLHSVHMKERSLLNPRHSLSYLSRIFSCLRQENCEQAFSESFDFEKRTLFRWVCIDCFELSSGGSLL